MKTRLSFLFFLSISTAVFGQTTWSKRYSFSTVSELLAKSIHVDEAGIWVHGLEHDINYPRFHLFLLDQEGNVLQVDTIGQAGRSHVYGRKDYFHPISAGGYISAGQSWEPYVDTVLTEAELIRYDENGQVLWIKQYQNEGNNTLLLNVVETVDGGFMATGGIAPLDTSEDYDAYLIKTDGDGNMEWELVYGVAGDWDVYSDIQKINNRYLVSGFSTISEGNRGRVHEFDDDGNLLSTFEPSTELGLSNSVECLMSSGDNIYLVLYHPDLEVDHEANTQYLNKYDDNFNLLWSKKINNPEIQYDPDNYNLVDTGDGIISMGMTVDYNQSSWYQAGFTKFDYEGNKLWYRSHQYVEVGINQIYGLDYYEDHIYASGSVWFLPGDEPESKWGEEDYWVLKLDSTGCLIPGCHVGIKSLTGEDVGFKTYPNPATDLIQIYFDDLHKGRDLVFSLTNPLGQVVHQFTARVFDTTYHMNLADLPRGMYFLNLSQENKLIQTEKIVLQ